MRATESAGPVYSRREPEKTALYKVMQDHLLTFGRQWTDQASGHTLPKFVTEELHKFMDCGILGRGFAHLFCKTCHERHVVAFSCKVTVVSDDSMGEKDPLLARLLAAATAGAPPAGPANKRKVIRIVLDPDARPVAKGKLCAQ